MEVEDRQKIEDLLRALSAKYDRETLSAVVTSSLDKLKRRGGRAALYKGGITPTMLVWAAVEAELTVRKSGKVRPTLEALFKGLRGRVWLVDTFDVDGTPVEVQLKSVSHARRLHSSGQAWMAMWRESSRQEDNDRYESWLRQVNRRAKAMKSYKNSNWKSVQVIDKTKIKINRKPNTRQSNAQLIERLKK
ncbi:MAG: hypothetical protein AB7S93_22030 [Xanthobacteraceae bacterium]